MNVISNYLDEVCRDWEASRDAFPRNIYLKHYWPIPFFGNPATARVATVGVNPSSGEFTEDRRWDEVRTKRDWKLRLRNYFIQNPPPHKWFTEWRQGLTLLDCSYEAGTAAHFDVSYRPTKAMVKNPSTDRAEFREMIERDVQWLFRLLPLCPNLRGLLVFGPVVRDDGSTESLVDFVRKSAPEHGFIVCPSGNLRWRTPEGGERLFFVHEVPNCGGGTIGDRVIADLSQHRAHLRGWIWNATSGIVC
jgi:hypothetical protein